MKLSKAEIDVVLQSVIVKKDPDLCIITKERTGFLHANEAALEKIFQAVDDIRPKMIVFDPISMFWGSEAGLNDMAKAVSKFMGKLVERSHACVEMVNHVGKVSSGQKDMTQFAGRGGTGLPSHSRVSRMLREVMAVEFKDLTGIELEDGQNAMLCNVNKFTDGSPLYNKPFLIVREGFLFSRMQLSKAKELEVEKQMSDLQKVFTFIKEERRCGRFPTKEVLVGHFTTCGDPLPKVRVRTAFNMLQYQGYLGEKVRLVDSPDATIKDQVIIVTDVDGKEV